MTRFDKLCFLGLLISLVAVSAGPGTFTEGSPLLATKAALFARTNKFSDTHPELLRLGNALYHDNSDCPGKSAEDLGPPAIAAMLEAADAKRATAIADAMLDKFLKGHGLDRSRAVNYVRGMGLTTIDGTLGNGWSVNVLVDPDGIALELDGRAYFVPSSLIALHELGHVARIAVGEPSPKTHTGLLDAKAELGPALEQIVYTDEVYKRVRGLPLDAEVRYPRRLKGNGHELELGVVANTVRALWKRYGSVEEGLMSVEGMQFVRGYYKSICP